MNKILVVDDTATIYNFIKAQLCDTHQVISAESGKVALETCIDKKFDLILVDIEMPEMDGFEFSKQLVESKLVHSASIVFLSSKASTENIIKSFEHGADDFIDKGIGAAATVKKIDTILNYHNKIRDHISSTKKLTSMVDITMQQASFYGSCMNLMSDMQKCHHEKQLSDMVFNFMKQNSLFTALCFHQADSELCFDQSLDACSPIESKVFNLLKDKGRIYNFGNRAMFNDGKVSLLIKNMPETETTLYGLLIDVLAKLILSINDYYLTILQRRTMVEAQFSLDVIVDEIHKGLNELNTDKGDIIHHIISDISTSFHALGFDDAQEVFLVELIEKSVKSQKNGNERFQSISQSITKLKALLVIDEPITLPILDATDDVELF